MIDAVIKRHKVFLSFVAILLVCVLAYGKIVGMYFYLEDYLILYSIQHPESSQAGYGSGVFGRPFGYAVTPFIPFYYLFGLEPWGYYLVEIFLYFAASLVVYFFTKTLTSSVKIAFGSAIIFASGYVGSGSLYRLAVGWQNILAAIFISLSSIFYYRYIKFPTLRNYILALTLSLFTSEFSFYRSHGIILIILGMEILFNFNWLKSMVRMAPFVLSYWYFYIFSLQGIMDQGSKTASFVRTVFQEGNYHYLLTPFKTLESLFIPDKFNPPFLLFIAILAGALLWKRSKVLVYCLLFALANYLVHFYNSPGSVQQTTHRYLTVSFVGVAAFWGIFLNKVFKSTGIYLLFCLLIVILNITLARSEQKEIIKNRSAPNREFWLAFKKVVQTIPPNSIIYIDSKNDGVSKPARDSALSAGSMSATTSFAVFYGLKWDELYLAENFSELLSLIKSGKVAKNDIFTFFYSRQDGLINTTQQTKNALKEGKRFDIAKLGDINLNFSSPILLNFSSVVDVNFSELGEETKLVNLEQYLDYISLRSWYYNKVSASASSEVKYAEIEHVKDRDVETSWRADDAKWAANHSEEIVLDLGETRQVGAVKIIPANASRTPIKYIWECSLDLIVWEKLANFEKNADLEKKFVDKFNKAECAFLKLIITGTVSGPPQISEIEVIEDKFADLDMDLADKIEENPFIYMSPGDKENLSNYFLQNGITGKVCIYSDKYNTGSSKCNKHNFKPGVSKLDTFFIDQGGTVLQKIEISVPKQVEVNLKNVQAKSLTYDELEKMGYIARFAE